MGARWRVFSKADIRFIKKNRLLMSSGRLAEKLNCSRTMIQRFLAKHKLAPPKKLTEQWRREGLLGRTSFTPAEDKIIKRFYLKLPVKTLAAKLNRSHTGINCRLRQLGLVIPRKIIEQRKKDSQIKKGNIPPNKGKKLAQYLTKKQIKKFKETSFKKGNLPKNTLYDGAIRIHHNHKERGCKPYKWIRIRMGYWEMLHVHNWKKKYGPVPEGYIIVFKNGDTMNCSVRNLKCLSHQEHCENTRNADRYIATKMAAVRGAKGKYDIDLVNELLKDKKLINAKRLQLQLKRIINERTDHSKKA